MRMIDPYSTTEHATQTTTPADTIFEPQAPYEDDGEGASSSASSFSEAPRATGQNPSAEQMSRPVTAATARRRKLWEKGTLILEDPYGAYRVTEITDDWVAHTEPRDPELEPQVFELFPKRTLLFATSSNGAEGSNGTEDSNGSEGSKAAEGPNGTDGHAKLDAIDTRHALWHLRSALEDAKCIEGRPLLKMGIERDLQRAERILANHADRNGFGA